MRFTKSIPAPVLRKVARATVLIFILVASAGAQVQVGDNLRMNLNGILSGGYTDNYANLQPSTHGLTFGGNADLAGSYYSPNFLSFHLQPFYNQSRANSAYQSISDSTGLNSSAGIFNGSNYPGSISFSKTYNGSGTFAVPGGADITSHGDSQALTVGWGVRIPDKPQLSFNFQDGSNAYSIYGSNGESNSHFDSFAANVTDTLAGFNLRAGYQFAKSSSKVPQFLTLAPQTSSARDNSFSFSASHRLPFNGSFNAGATHSDNSAEFSSGSYNATLDNLNGGLTFNPIRNLNLGSSVQYNNNLAGTLYQSILAAGGVIPPHLQQSSHSLDINNYVNYQIPPIHIMLMGTVDHREQSLFGTSLAANSYTATAVYSNTLLGGFLNVVAGANENTIDVNNQHSTGVISSINYSHRIQRWDFSAGVNYARNQQTLLINYMTSSEGYNLTLGRRLGTYSHFSLGAGGSKSSLNGVSGSSTTTQNYTAGLSVRYIGFNAGYSKSNGNAILTGTGLVASPVPLPLVTDIVMYGGKAYSFGVGSSPLRHLTISASYSKALSDTTSEFVSSKNRMNTFTTRVEYRFRQMNFQGGYSRLYQGFSLSGTPPIMVGSLYVGVSRWFDFF